MVPYRTKHISYPLSFHPPSPSTTMSTTESDSTDNAAPDFVLDPSDPLYMLLNNTHDAKSDGPFDFSFPMDLDFNDPSFSVFVDPSALFIDGKAPVHSTSTIPLQPQDLLNHSYPFSFSSPTLSSASASADESLPGLSPSSPGSSSSTRASPAAPGSTAGTLSHSRVHPLDTYTYTRCYLCLLFPD